MRDVLITLWRLVGSIHQALVVKSDAFCTNHTSALPEHGSMKTRNKSRPGFGCWKLKMDSAKKWLSNGWELSKLTELLDR